MTFYRYDDDLPAGAPLDRVRITHRTRARGFPDQTEDTDFLFAAPVPVHTFTDGTLRVGPARWALLFAPGEWLRVEVNRSTKETKDA